MKEAALSRSGTDVLTVKYENQGNFDDTPQFKYW